MKIFPAIIYERSHKVDVKYSVFGLWNSGSVFPSTTAALFHGDSEQECLVKSSAFPNLIILGPAIHECRRDWAIDCELEINRRVKQADSLLQCKPFTLDDVKKDLQHHFQQYLDQKSGPGFSWYCSVLENGNIEVLCNRWPSHFPKLNIMEQSVMISTRELNLLLALTQSIDTLFTELGKIES